MDPSVQLSVQLFEFRLFFSRTHRGQTPFVPNDAFLGNPLLAG